MKKSMCNTLQRVKNVAVTGLNGRLTLRLPECLLEWVREQGGSSYVRDLLLGQRNGAAENKLQQPSLRPNDSEDLVTARRLACIQDQRETLDGERDLLVMDRELLNDEERLLNRRETKLDRERELLKEKREQLEEEWCELEEIRDDFDIRKDSLATTQALLSYFPHSLPSRMERP